MISVINARYINQYKIYLTFSDQKKGIVDLENVILHDHRPIINMLADIDQFKRFKVSADTLVWENGVDLAPKFLYQKLILSST